jgi:uncharacterized protein YyaL (SSP411 family)
MPILSASLAPTCVRHEPYLKSAAHKPVNGYPWGEEAFARAGGGQTSGATGGHVIDRESYENPQVAHNISLELIFPIVPARPPWY